MSRVTDPTPLEILERSAEVRAQWTPLEVFRRAPWIYPPQTPEVIAAVGVRGFLGSTQGLLAIDG